MVVGNNHTRIRNFDSNNISLGLTKSRALVHEDGDWHRTVHIYVKNKQGNILVHLRSPNKDSHPNKWDARFGGHVSKGISYNEAAKKELEEEIGIKVLGADLKMVGIYSSDHGKNKEHVQVYFLLFEGSLKDLNFSDN